MANFLKCGIFSYEKIVVNEKIPEEKLPDSWRESLVNALRFPPVVLDSKWLVGNNVWLRVPSR